MADTGLPVRFYRQTVGLIQELSAEKIWQDVFLRNTVLGVLTVITCLYSLIG